MENNIDKLISILIEQVKYNEILLKMGIEKEKFIKERDVKGLNALVFEEQNIVKKIIFLEKQRGVSVNSIQKEYKIENEKLSLIDILENIDSAKKEEILAVSQKLRGILDELKNQNDLNNKLIQISLDYLDFNINVLKSVVNSGPKTYGNKAHESNSGNKNYFDSKY